jgi:hypothetical protein
MPALCVFLDRLACINNSILPAPAAADCSADLQVGIFLSSSVLT